MAKINGNQNANVLKGTSKRDTIKGLGGDDELFGYAGNDILEGGTGKDHLDGGDGIDRAEYRKSKAGVTVNLGLNFGLGGEAEGDTFTSIENVYGSRYANLLVGDGGNNVLAGRNGNDTLKGEAGADRLLGGNGKDTLEGGDDNDRLDGGRGDDELNGGDSIIVTNTLGCSTADTVEQVKFDDGTIWKIADIITRVDNKAPVAVDDLGSMVLPDQPVVIPVSNMLSNDSDPDGDELSLVSVYDAKGGTVEITEDGDVVFTPEAGFSGTATFLYTVTDGTAAAEAMCVFDVEVEFSEFIGNWWAETIDLSTSSLPCYIDCHYGNDVATGSNLRDLILGNLGDDALNGGGGNDDFLIGLGHGFDRFDGGDGYDKVVANEDGVSIGLIGDFNASVEEFSCAGFANVGITGTWQAQTLDFTGVTLTDIQWIDAGRGNDTVLGSDGDDVIIGGLGNDTLTGGLGADTFVFADGDGQDVITDFNVADDVARLDEIAGFEDFAEVQGALSQAGADTLLDFGDGQTILFEDTLVSTLTSDNFDFLIGDL